VSPNAVRSLLTLVASLSLAPADGRGRHRRPGLRGAGRLRLRGDGRADHPSSGALDGSRSDGGVIIGVQGYLTKATALPLNTPF
jgi:hypothetical protein